jgi:hypothetical protein
MRRNLAPWALVALCSVAAEGQTRSGTRPALPIAEEIALARSAAPSAVSAKARVWAWNGNTYSVADSGSSVVNCYVGRPWVGAIEPHCFDEEASATIFPIQRRRVELYAQGLKEADVERRVADAIVQGDLKLPKRPAMTYMMSAAQHLVNGEGVAVGAWQPHLMIYYPNLTGESVGLPGFVSEVGFVENPGKPFAALVIPVKTFVPAPKR